MIDDEENVIENHNPNPKDVKPKDDKPLFVKAKLSLSIRPFDNCLKEKKLLLFKMSRRYSLHLHLPAPRNKRNDWKVLLKREVNPKLVQKKDNMVSCR